MSNQSPIQIGMRMHCVFFISLFLIANTGCSNSSNSSLATQNSVAKVAKQEEVAAIDIRSDTSSVLQNPGTKNTEQEDKTVVDGRSRNRSDLLKLGAKITTREGGIIVDIRNSPNFNDESVDLLLVDGKDVLDLTLENVRLTDIGIAKFGPLENVGRLILNGTSITGKSLSQLSHLPMKDRLWSVGLKNTAMKDDDLNALADLPHLVRIDLTGTKVTDAVIRHLEGRNWRMINLKGTAVTPETVQRLREMYPKADVFY
jgi:hypothetical protein